MIDEEIKLLTEKLVNINSVNGTAGEKEVSLYIRDYFAKLPYFMKHPENLITIPIPGDSLGRMSVMALLKGEKDNNKNTVIIHGHTDMVGIEDYGPLKELACFPDKLEAALREGRVNLPPEVLSDLNSGDYMFGRGASDMKSGDAVFMVLIKRFSENPDKLSGNIIGLFNPVEENLHTGIITSLPELKKLRGEGYKFIAALNNDFTTKLYEGDDKITLYTGMGGKVLPCFYIRGKETHVGQCFEGFDASFLAAAIINELQLSCDYADENLGEMAPPPSVLKLKDLKDFYNVQTAKEALLYFNYFVFDSDMSKITSKLLNAGKSAFKKVLYKINEENDKYSDRNLLPLMRFEYPINVLSFADLYNKAREKTDFSKDEYDRIYSEEEKKNTDKRELQVPLIRYLLHVCGITDPAIVLYFAPPYVPHCRLHYDEESASDEEQKIYDILKETSDEVSEGTGTEFRIKHFYPSLSDSSYIDCDDDDNSINVLRENFPVMENIYPVPIDDIRDLSIPALNIGVYGRDAHKWTERVNMPYTFGVLPELEKSLIERLLSP